MANFAKKKQQQTKNSANVLTFFSCSLNSIRIQLSSDEGLNPYVWMGWNYNSRSRILKKKEKLNYCVLFPPH